MSPKRARNNLREIMTDKGYSMIKLSRCGVSVSTIAYIVNANHVPKGEIRTLLAKELGVTVTDIWPEIDRIAA